MRMTLPSIFISWTCTNSAAGLLAEPGAPLVEVGDTRQHGHGSVAGDQHRARQLAGPGAVDLVTQAFVEAIGEGPALGVGEACPIESRGDLIGRLRQRIGSDQ